MDDTTYAPMRVHLQGLHLEANHHIVRTHKQKLDVGFSHKSNICPSTITNRGNNKPESNPELTSAVIFVPANAWEATEETSYLYHVLSTTLAKRIRTDNTAMAILHQEFQGSFLVCSNCVLLPFIMSSLYSWKTFLFPQGIIYITSSVGILFK